MIIGTRPTIGYIGYLWFGKSWLRIVLAFAFLAVIAYSLLKRSKESLTLQFMRPIPFPPSLIILPPPQYETFNAFDACAVESSYNIRNIDTPTVNSVTRFTYVYQWSSNIAPNDFWTHVISKLPGVKILFLDLVKSLKRSPLDGMMSSGGWGGRPGWAIWMAAGGSLLWGSGGILIPNGVLMTRPYEIDIMQTNVGLLVAKQGKFRPIALGSPTEHPILKEILKAVKNYDYYEEVPKNGVEFATPLEDLLTRSIKKACNVSTPKDIRESVCSQFTVIYDTSVVDINFEKAHSKEDDNALFLRYTGDPDVIRYDHRQAQKLFRKHKLDRYCPNVNRHLDQEIKRSL